MVLAVGNRVQGGGDASGTTHDALIITDTKDFKEDVNYQLYPIGFKLYYGKEK